MTKLYLEDLHVGQIFGSDCYEVTSDNIKEFARQWDPQIFHLDEEGARNSFFGGLAASGWHTGCITMRLLCTGGFQPEGGVIGAGLDELKWHRPVRPGDVLTLRTEILELRPMRSKPGQAICRVRVITTDQNGEPVQTLVSPLVVKSREEA